MPIPVLSAPAIRGPVFSCNVCPWSGRDPSCTNASEVNDAGQKIQQHIAVCPVCFSFVSPDSRPLARGAQS